MDRHNNGPGTDLGPGSGADAQGYIEQVLGMTRPPRSRNSLACTTAGGCEGGGATGIHALEVPDSPSFQSQYQTSHEELGLSLENAADWLDDEIALPGGLQAPTCERQATGRLPEQQCQHQHGQLRPQYVQDQQAALSATRATLRDSYSQGSQWNLQAGDMFRDALSQLPGGGVRPEDTLEHASASVTYLLECAKHHLFAGQVCCQASEHNCTSPTASQVLSSSCGSPGAAEAPPLAAELLRLQDPPRASRLWNTSHLHHLGPVQDERAPHCAPTRLASASAALEHRMTPSVGSGSSLSMYASPMRGRSSSSLSGSPSPAEWAAPVSAPMAGMQMQVQPRSPLHSDRNATSTYPSAAPHHPCNASRLDPAYSLGPQYRASALFGHEHHYEPGLVRRCSLDCHPTHSWQRVYTQQGTPSIPMASPAPAPAANRHLASWSLINEDVKPDSCGTYHPYLSGGHGHPHRSWSLMSDEADPGALGTRQNYPNGGPGHLHRRHSLCSPLRGTDLRPPLLEAFKRKADFVEEFDMGTDAEDDSDNNIDSGESMEEWLDRRAACTNKPKRALQKGRSTRAGASRNCDPSWPPPLQAQRGGWLKRVVTPTAAALAMAEAQEAADSPEERQGVHRRKHHNPWTVEETQALIDGVEGCGGGKWSQIKKMAPPVLAQRSAVDLKDKWRNLMRIAIPPAGTPPPSKSGDRKRDVPQELLARVRELAPLIGKKPGPEARYAAYAAATALRRRVR